MRWEMIRASEDSEDANVKPTTSRILRLAVVPAVIFCVAVAGGLGLGRAFLGGKPDKETAGRHLHRRQPVEIVLVYTGSPTCSYSTDPRVREAVGIVQDRLEEWARQHYAGFSSIGIEAARLPADGYAHLRQIADFSEISVGAGWTNLGFIWLSEEHPEAPIGTPQVLLLTRLWNSGSARLLVPADSFTETVRIRKLGVEEIADWARSDSLITPAVAEWVARHTSAVRSVRSAKSLD